MVPPLRSFSSCWVKSPLSLLEGIPPVIASTSIIIPPPEEAPECVMTITYIHTNTNRPIRIHRTPCPQGFAIFQQKSSTKSCKVCHYEFSIEQGRRQSQAEGI